MQNLISKIWQHFLVVFNEDYFNYIRWIWDHRSKLSSTHIVGYLSNVDLVSFKVVRRIHMNAHKLKVNITSPELFDKMCEDVSVQFSNDQGNNSLYDQS